MEKKHAAIVSGIVQASAGIGGVLMSPGLESVISGCGVQTALTATAVPFIIMIPVAVWSGFANRAKAVVQER